MQEESQIAYFYPMSNFGFLRLKLVRSGCGLMVFEGSGDKWFLLPCGQFGPTYCTETFSILNTASLVFATFTRVMKHKGIVFIPVLIV